jgi:hypothetical protein
MITTIAILAFYITGIHALMMPGKLMAFIGGKIRQHKGKWWYKPVLGCVYCMVSVWAVPGYFALMWEPTAYVVYVFALSGMLKMMERVGQLDLI